MIMTMRLMMVVTVMGEDDNDEDSAQNKVADDYEETRV